jgi:hypothetical protein
LPSPNRWALIVVRDRVVKYPISQSVVALTTRIKRLLRHVVIGGSQGSRNQQVATDLQGPNPLYIERLTKGLTGSGLEALLRVARFLKLDSHRSPPSSRFSDSSCLLCAARSLGSQVHDRSRRSGSGETGSCSTAICISDRPVAPISLASLVCSPDFLWGTTSILHARRVWAWRSCHTDNSRRSTRTVERNNG